MSADGVGDLVENEVVVPLTVAIGGLPAVCAITGDPADGAVPLRVGRSLTRWKAPIVRMPMSKPVFEKWSKRKNIHIKARGIASVLTAVGVVLAFRNAGLAAMVLAIAVAIHLIDLWAERTANDVEPQLERDGGNVRISGVHQAFAAAVAETVR